MLLTLSRQYMFSITVPESCCFLEQAIYVLNHGTGVMLLTLSRQYMSSITVPESCCLPWAGNICSQSRYRSHAASLSRQYMFSITVPESCCFLEQAIYVLNHGTGVMLLPWAGNICSQSRYRSHAAYLCPASLFLLNFFKYSSPLRDRTNVPSKYATTSNVHSNENLHDEMTLYVPGSWINLTILFCSASELGSPRI